jgi:hypothetical protein
MVALLAGRNDMSAQALSLQEKITRIKALLSFETADTEPAREVSSRDYIEHNQPYRLLGTLDHHHGTHFAEAAIACRQPAPIVVSARSGNANRKSRPQMSGPLNLEPRVVGDPIFQRMMVTIVVNPK